MLRAVAVRLAVDPTLCVDRITLDHAARHQRRRALSADGGLAFLLDLERPIPVEDGDAFELDDGRLVAVLAAAEPLLEVRAPDGALPRLAWHVGNRHVPCEVAPDALYLGADHVLAEMLRGLGADVREISRPFRPERGAYAQGGHGHSHGHSHAHDHHDHDAP